MARYFIQLAYDGTNYHGWQIQGNATTIQGILNNALSVYLREPITTYGAGRTDAGVHAKFYVAQFDSQREDLEKDAETHLYKLNGILPHDIALYKIKKVHNDASARFDAYSRTYNYYTHFGKMPFLKNYSTRITGDLNVEAMNAAAAKMLEYNDFTSLSKFSEDIKTNLCTVSDAHWYKYQGQLIFTITANRFLRNMVRATVGTLLNVGRERMSISEFCELIELQSRGNCGSTVPAKGLFLVDIKYPYAI